MSEYSFDARRADMPVIRWFAPPVLPTPERTRRAQVLWKLAWPFFAVVTLALGVSVAIEPATLSRRAITIAAVGLLVAVLHEINRRGRTTLASWILVVGLTAIVTQRAWNTGGIHAPVAVFYTLFVLMAAGLLGTRAGVVTALLCLMGATFLAGAEAIGWLTVPGNTQPPWSSFVFVVLTVGLALVLQTLNAKPQPALPSFNWLTGAVPESGRDVSRTRVVHKPTKIADVARVVARATMMLQPGRTIDVTGDAMVTCRSDPDLLRRILENLVSNAIKHTPDGGTVQVHVSSLPGRARVAVRDEGPGIPSDVRHRIFDKFGATIVGSGPRVTGLGLAFVKLAVESHGGTIRVEDAKPRGSTFVVELPA